MKIRVLLVLLVLLLSGCAGSVPQPETTDVVNGSFGIPRYSHPAGETR